MDNPEKPERVEAGQRWSPIWAVDLTATVGMPAPGGRRRMHWGDDVNTWPEEDIIANCIYRGGPATPGTATATPAQAAKARWLEARGLDESLNPIAKPSAPVYGRMVGELRAPDGTPLTALQVIQARREPEPWVPSCDIDFDIPDADEGWRR